MNEKNNQEAFDLEEQIEESKASLERINGWISSCDSKAGTILALTGVLLTIIFTNNGFLAMNKIMQKIFSDKECLVSLTFNFVYSSCNRFNYRDSIFN